MITVLIVDDHELAREGFTRLADHWHDVEVVGAASDGIEGVALYRELHPDVVLMDLEMSGPTDSDQATRRILEIDPDARVVILTSVTRRESIQGAIAAGAIGYVLKDASLDELASAIRAASRGESPLDPKVARMVLEMRSGPASVERLSERERQVLGLLARGMSNRQIGGVLGISERTVKGLLTRVYRQIGVDDRLAAALWATHNGVVGRGQAA